METTTIVRDLPLSQPPRLQLEADVVGITVVPVAPDAMPRLTVEFPEETEGPKVDVEARDGSVYVKLDSRDIYKKMFGGGWSFGSRLSKAWRITARLEVPHGIDASIKSDAGQIRVQGLNGDFDLRANAGKIDVDAVTGHLHLRTDAGKIDCTALRGSVDAATSAGAISLDVSELNAGEHSVRADVGKIDITLPADAPVRVETRTSIGRTRNAFGAGRADAPAQLRVQTEVGAINIQASPRSGATAGQIGAGMSPEARQAAVMQILEQVANHELSAEEANRRIADLR